MIPHTWIHYLHTSLPALIKNIHVPGVAISLMECGEEPVTVCFGVQDLKSKRPVTPETVFEAASLGKPVFAYMVMQMVVEGLLELDTPLSAYLPEPWVPDEPRLSQVTTRRVLSHSTGLPNWFRDDNPRQLVYSPGERFGYSGEGFLYLQRAVEMLTGQPLERLMGERVFNPLGMKHSFFSCPNGNPENLAQGHDAEGKELPKWKPWPNAGTSLHTTLEDYCRFLQSMIGARGGGMITPQTLINENTAWGLGWGLKRIAGDLTFWQWGDNDGWKHFAGGWVDKGRGVVVLTNGERGSQVWKEVLHQTMDQQDAIYTWLSALQ